MARKQKLLIVGVPLAFIAAQFYPFLPVHDFTPCAVKNMLGIDCPGCGFIRSIVALAHGELRKSIDLQPMGVVAVIIMTYLWLKAVFTTFILRRDIGFMSSAGVKIVSTAFAAGLFIQWFFYLGCGRKI